MRFVCLHMNARIGWVTVLKNLYGNNSISMNGFAHWSAAQA